MPEGPQISPVALDHRHFLLHNLKSGDVAQLEERLLRMQEVRGSNPLISTKDFGHLGGLFFLRIMATAGSLSKIYFL
jgi:hypothetical protein